jgi:hypothetical protein
MKISSDFVTNSSSSSFLVSADAIQQYKFEEILKEIYIESRRTWWEEDMTDEELLEGFELSENNNMNLRVMTKEEYDISEWEDTAGKEYTDQKYYVVDNNSNVRFDWSVVEDILGKHNISWEMGYCD